MAPRAWVGVLALTSCRSSNDLGTGAPGIPAAHATIQGVVVDREERPLVEARIQAVPPEQGGFDFPGTKTDGAGRYTVTVTWFGDPASQRVPETVPMDITGIWIDTAAAGGAVITKDTAVVVSFGPADEPRTRGDGRPRATGPVARLVGWRLRAS